MPAAAAAAAADDDDVDDDYDEEKEEEDVVVAVADAVAASEETYFAPNVQKQVERNLHKQHLEKNGQTKQDNDHRRREQAFLLAYH